MEELTKPHVMWYSHYDNGVHNGAVSIPQWDLLSDSYKVNPIGQQGKILVIVGAKQDMLHRKVIYDDKN